MKLIQSWDDGVTNDIKLADMLRKYKATATLNLNIALNKKERSAGWKYKETDVGRLGTDEMPELYRGFEIASHSLKHPHLPQCTPEALKEELEASRARLQEIFHQPILGFAYPFGDYSEPVKAALRAAGYTHARTVKKSDGTFPPKDPMEFHPDCRFSDPEFWTLYERNKAMGSPVFFCWGHSYELINDLMWNDFEEKVARLSSDPANTWVNISSLFG